MPPRHGRVMFERHRLHFVSPIEVPQRTDEHGGRAEFSGEPGLTRLVTLHLPPRIERFRHQKNFHRAPPVTGGKNATSSPSRTGWSGRAYSILTATSVLPGKGIRADLFQTSAAQGIPLQIGRAHVWTPGPGKNRR